MKKILLFFLFTLFSYNLFSQNGGQLNYNDLLRIDYFGYSGGSHVFRVKNLQPCPMVAEYTIWGSATINTLNIFPYEAVFFSVPSPQYTVVYVRAKAKTLCGVTAPDRGWVESQSTTTPVLSTPYFNIKFTRLSPHKIEVLFTTSETTNTKSHNIKLSHDGIIFKTVKIITPSGLIQNKTYKVIINQ